MFHLMFPKTNTCTFWIIWRGVLCLYTTHQQHEKYIFNQTYLILRCLRWSLIVKSSSRKCFSVFGCSSPSLFSCFFCCCVWTCCSSKDKKYLTRNWNTKIKYSRIIESEILINLIKEKLLIEIFKVEEK